MLIQRLSWAGIKIESDGQLLLIDPVETFQGRGVSVGPANPYLFSGSIKADTILLTHLHSDHYDSEVIKKTLRVRGQVFSSDQIVDELLSDGLETTGIALDESQQIGPFTITPVFAMDGIGDKQVSWVVEDREHRILHGGDTMWHTQLWSIAKKFGHFDAVFLPINAPVLNFPELSFGPVPLTMTPLQALAATRILNADVLVPIHYGFHQPGVYEQYPDMLSELNEQSKKQDVPFKLIEEGEYLTIPKN
ncbi:L-ascorbate metabolism protein UlaG, beta-lactamase superfamily [Spirosoma fluviale]|uniref:L-ascorbate metabolism protein UlaG, beta-lactamase superfamily n=2 Tax=Spirosoma fluviale TaxID=1597977 RepID=A0A286GUN0_9BACT|nr:L-ascorbate metabolism protein UlaG, beta-lactamase superfamily [Spirosoma fluviale]